MQGCRERTCPATGCQCKDMRALFAAPAAAAEACDLQRCCMFTAATEASGKLNAVFLNKERTSKSVTDDQAARKPCVMHVQVPAQVPACMQH
jgi:hypothetical protein